MIRLSVNVNKIALLRNARGGNIPDVVAAARTCIAAGCHGITVHPRPDARHITFQDVFDLAAMLTVEFNIEGFPSPEFLDLVLRVRPTQATLVPDPPDVLTSNAGWNLSGEMDWLGDVLAQLGNAGIRTSLFLETDLAQIRRARELGANRIELYTGPYAKAVKGLQEVSIGHALIADALYMGMTRSVKAYLKALGSKPLAAKRKPAKR
jgi:pyridoxine 5-phosphate synthase